MMKRRFFRRTSAILCLTAALTVAFCPAASGFAAEENGAGGTPGGDYEYVIPMEHDFITQYDEMQRFVVRDGNREALYDYSGKKLSESYDSLGPLPWEQLWSATDGDTLSILDNDGEVISFDIPEEQFLTSFGDGIFVLLDIPRGEADNWWQTYEGDVHVYDYEGTLLSSFSYPEHRSTLWSYGSYDLNFCGGLLAFRAPNGLCGAIDISGNEVISPQFTGLWGFDFNGNYSIASKDGKYGVVDRSGKTVVDFSYDSIQEWRSPQGDKTLIIIEKDGKWGLMDGDFRMLAEPQFSDMEIHSVCPEDSLLIVRKKTESGDSTYGLMSSDGKLLLDCVYSEISEPSEGRIAVSNTDGKWAYFDCDGRQITDFSYTGVSDYSEGLAYVEGESCGFLDRGGQLVLRQTYVNPFNIKSIRFSEGLAEMKDAEGNARYIDRAGNTVIQPTEGEIWRNGYPMTDGLAVVASGAIMNPGKYGVIRYLGEPSEWAAADVKEAIELAIVPEALQNRYQAAVSRGEFCELACRLLQKSGVNLPKPDKQNPNPFSDSDSQYVYTLSRLGVVDGRGDGIFDPDAAITRQEAAKLLSKTADVLDIARTSLALEYSDQNEAAEWAVPFISDVSNIGVMLGVSENRFDPQGTYTREQSIMTMLRLSRL